MTPTDDLFAAMRAHVVEALAALLPELPPENFARVLVEPPRDAAHGDMATNAAMVVAKAAKLAPPKLAASLCEKLSALPMVVSATPAGPGFVNIKLADGFVRGVVPAVLAAGPAYGDGPKREGGPVNVEYVSANPTGPMHVGHCRGAVVGDALALLLRKAGFDVTREYYVNDAGAQVLALAYAAYWRYLQALGTTMTEEDYAAATPSGLQYRGDYLVPVGVALRQIFKDTLSGPGATPADPSLWLDTVRDFTVEAMMAAIREDLAALGVQHDIFVSERQVVSEGWLEKAEATLTAKELIYTGVLEPPKGKTPDDWEPRPQVLFRATQFGDDVDRPLRKSDGSGTYFANDVANHLAKIDRGFPQLVQVWGADHGGYVKRMQAAVAALSDRKVSLDVVLTQIVHVMKNGEPVRMSKRAGTYITLRDLIDEVGKDAVRFTMLTRKADAQMEFDLDKVVEQSRDNPVFYVQYAHARCRSVLRQAGDPALADLASAPLDSLSDPAELALIRRMAGWPRTVEAAAVAREPHRIAFFLQDLASDFHVLWNRGRDDSTLRFIRAEEPEATKARLALVAATATILRSGLAVMGVEPVEEMR
ncbi:arginine--tRNA ligase [Falsiroseomonas stagni]|uniref:Arginine--tRNA ligase n=1 Tax=Falsiroseomonas stagni DSM 19981 TaxID=1123062 RepID=A0A1I4AS96_9PROT|nr:arginine--tRNA ligase [Falsiroseomonas stagni]SFK58526.1 arginyl-tRNA synthetase [Falsiroseomonas stagni DSM 19981]